MTSVICTLFEGSFHYGLAALINSLHAQGFRGKIYAGYRGTLPPWVSALTALESKSEYAIADQLVVTFLPLETEMHLTNYKPTFLSELWSSQCASAKKLFYFDPDIVVT